MNRSDVTLGLGAAGLPPPFDSGSSAKAGPALTQDVLQRRGHVLAAARQAATRASARSDG